MKIMCRIICLTAHIVNVMTRVNEISHISVSRFLKREKRREEVVQNGEESEGNSEVEWSDVL